MTTTFNPETQFIQWFDCIEYQSGERRIVGYIKSWMENYPLYLPTREYRIT